METTLVLVKPDGVQRRLVGRILARFEEKGLEIAGLRLARLEKALLERQDEFFLDDGSAPDTTTTQENR